MAGIKVHPAQFDAWFEKMPVFLLRDAARLATDHTVVIAAASRLAELGGRENLALLGTLKKRFEKSPLEQVMTSILIKAGDRPTLSRELKNLKSPLRRLRLNAAIVLSGAGDNRGLSVLRAVVKAAGKRSDSAALALGRYGKFSDEKLLRKRLGRSGNAVLIRSALGEIALRRYFPHQHRALLGKMRLLGGRVSETGLYERWFAITEQVVSRGTKDSLRFVAALKEIRRSPPAGLDDTELFERQLAAFMDFWNAMNERLQTPVRPSWPVTFEAAMSAIASTEKSENAESARVAATVALLAALGTRLGYPKLAVPTSDLLAVSPYGERAVDGNMATAWHISPGSNLRVAHRPNRTIAWLMIMTSCPHGTPPEPLAIEISGKSPDGRGWRVAATLSGKSRYFQRVDVGKRSAGKVTIAERDAKPGSAHCITELRASYR
jgi:hypothetical protein